MDLFFFTARLTTNGISNEIRRKVLTGNHQSRIEHDLDRRTRADWERLLPQVVSEIAEGNASYSEILQPEPDIDIRGSKIRHKIILPGSFNPLHSGHTEMARIATRWIKSSAWFEFSIHNADKPDIQADQICERLISSLVRLEKKDEQPTATYNETFCPHGLLLTSTATYLEKARLFPECHFAIGADTIVRVADPKFYDESTKHRDRAFAELTELGCRFLVFGRTKDHDSQTPFLELTDLDLPKPLLKICDSVHESDFRNDISSTKLRHS